MKDFVDKDFPEAANGWLEETKIEKAERPERSPVDHAFLYTGSSSSLVGPVFVGNSDAMHRPETDPEPPSGKPCKS